MLCSRCARAIVFVMGQESSKKDLKIRWGLQVEDAISSGEFYENTDDLLVGIVEEIE